MMNKNVADLNRLKAAIKNVILPAWKTVKRVFPPVDICRINISAHKRGNAIQKLKLISYSDYCKKSGGKITVLEETQERIVYEPPYYPEQKGVEHRCISPPIYVVELDDVIVHGGSGMIIANDHALNDLCAHDKEDRIDIVGGSVRRNTNEAVYLEVTIETEELDRAVNLCGIAADNYYHLTIEILSRYEYVKKYTGDERIPVLMDEAAGKYPQYKDLAKAVLGDAKVVYVPKYKRVRCKRVICPSMNSWFPLNVRHRSDFRISDNLIASSAIENIRKATEKLRRKSSEIKLFISRKKASLSRILNENEVESLFEKNGYRVICTENLTFREQVALFSEASCIVGASGAAMTNLVYCNPGTVFGCIIPEKYNFCIYSTIAYFTNCKILFFDAKTVQRGNAISTELWNVDVCECQNYINFLDTCRISRGL